MVQVFSLCRAADAVDLADQADLHHLPHHGSYQGILDAASLETNNDRQFLDFELRLSKTRDHVHLAKRYIKSRDHTSGTDETVSQGPRTAREVSADRIVRSVRDRVALFEARTQNTAQGVPAGSSRRSEQFLTQAISDGRVRRRQLPRLPLESLGSVCEKATEFNQAVEEVTLSFSNNQPPPGRKPVNQEAHSANILYRLFASIDKCDTARSADFPEHRCHLKVFDVDIVNKERCEYDLFLSRCSACSTAQPQERWLKTRCTYESESNLPPQPAGIKICTEIGQATPLVLPLSFNNELYWITRGGIRSYILPNDRPDLFRLLSDVIRQDLTLDETDRDLKLGQYRLALRLAKFLQALHDGPWLREPLSSQNTHIIPLNNNSKPFDDKFLNSIYFSSNIGRSPQLMSAEDGQSDTSERMLRAQSLLSLAGLLMDIENGKRPEHGTLDARFTNLYLASEAESDLCDNFRDALSFCVYSSHYYRAELQFESDENEIHRCFIRDRLVSPLQKQVQEWERMARSSSRQSSRGRDNSGPDQSSERSSGSFYQLWSDASHHSEVLSADAAAELMNLGEGTTTSRLGELKRATGTFDSGNSSRRVKIAILDTGLNDDLGNDGYYFEHPDIADRVIGRRNFCSGDGGEVVDADWVDHIGHGTHVARIILTYAPQAQLFIAKISQSQRFQMDEQTLLNALDWASDRADIINMSFSLGATTTRNLHEKINSLVRKGKILFAAASNTGQAGCPLWPANQLGVFAIHATSEDCVVDERISPQARHEPFANLATLGCRILSFWDNNYVAVSGTSFASPVAAAIAANVLAFTRKNWTSEEARDFQNYKRMREIMLEHMTVNRQWGVYHIIKPWVEGLWDGTTPQQMIWEKLESIRVGIPMDSVTYT